MPSAFPAPPGKFVGRDDYIARFKARVGHFPFFLFEGIAGIGKTALMLRLSKETRAVGLTRATYLNLWPGETIGSILARAESQFKKSGPSTGKQGDPYARLIDLLESHKAALLLDDVQRIRREDLTALIRTAKQRSQRSRILATCRGEPELSAMDKACIHLERVGGLRAQDVKKIAQGSTLSSADRELLEKMRRVGRRLPAPEPTLLARLKPRGTLPEEILARQTARSVNAFKGLMSHFGTRLTDHERSVLAGLLSLETPINQGVANKVLGKEVDSLIERQLLDVIDGDVYVHRLVRQVVDTKTGLGKDAALALAKALKSRAEEIHEPLALIRAAELLARVDHQEEAVDLLSSGWKDIRDFGLLEPYLKALASIGGNDVLTPRIKVLSARARMHKTNPSWVKDEMIELSKEKDPGRAFEPMPP
ncbi:MAG: ATP-binding protein [Myxococcota bacterium]